MNVPKANKGDLKMGRGEMEGGGKREEWLGGERSKIAIINPNLSVFLPINIIYSMQVLERF